MQHIDLVGRLAKWPQKGNKVHCSFNQHLNKSLLTNMEIFALTQEFAARVSMVILGLLSRGQRQLTQEVRWAYRSLCLPVAVSKWQKFPPHVEATWNGERKKPLLPMTSCNRQQEGIQLCKQKLFSYCWLPVTPTTAALVHLPELHWLVLFLETALWYSSIQISGHILCNPLDHMRVIQKVMPPSL